MQPRHKATKILNLKSTLSASELESPASTTSTGASTPSEFRLDFTPMAQQQELQISWADLEEDGWSDADDADAATPSSPSRTSRRRNRHRRRARATKEAEAALRAAAEEEAAAEIASQLESNRRDRAVVTWMDLGLGFNTGSASSSAAARTLQANIVATQPSWTPGASDSVPNDASGRHMQASYCLSLGIATTPVVVVPDASPQAAMHAFMIPQSLGMQSSLHVEATLKATALDVYED